MSASALGVVKRNACAVQPRRVAGVQGRGVPEIACAEQAGGEWEPLLGLYQVDRARRLRHGLPGPGDYGSGLGDTLPAVRLRARGRGDGPPFGPRPGWRLVKGRCRRRLPALARVAELVNLGAAVAARPAAFAGEGLHLVGLLLVSAAGALTWWRCCAAVRLQGSKHVRAAGRGACEPLPACRPGRAWGSRAAGSGSGCPGRPPRCRGAGGRRPGQGGLRGRPGALFRVDPAGVPGIVPFRAVGIRAVLFWCPGIQARGRPGSGAALARFAASLLVSWIRTAWRGRPGGLPGLWRQCWRFCGGGRVSRPSWLLDLAAFLLRGFTWSVCGWCRLPASWASC